MLGLLGWYGGQPKDAAMTACPFFHDLEAVLWAGIMLACLCGIERWLPSPLRTALDGTAVISYSLYLAHVPIQFYLLYPALQAAPSGTGHWSLAGLVVASGVLSWLVAWAGYRFIEMPFLRHKATLRV